jgi:hypothetical protein
VVSNTVTLPVSVSGGACTDSASGLNGSQLQALANKSGGRVNSMGLAVGQTIQRGRLSSSFAFVVATGLDSAIFGQGYGYASQGSCTVVPPSQNSGLVHLFHGTLPSGTPSIFGIVENGLDAGESIGLTGPHGTLNLTGGGFYGADLPAGATPALRANMAETLLVPLIRVQGGKEIQHEKREDIFAGPVRRWH